MSEMHMFIQRPLSHAEGSTITKPIFSNSAKRYLPRFYNALFYTILQRFYNALLSISIHRDFTVTK